MGKDKETIGIGVIGLGVGETHLVKYLSNDDCKVIALCDQDKEVLRLAKIKYPRFKYYDNAIDLLEDPDIKAVSIASYDHEHYQHIIKGISNQKHLFIEKPLVLQKDEFKNVLELHTRHMDLIISSNLVLRKTQRFKDLKSRILSGQMGEISLIQASYNYGRFAKITDGWRGDIQDYSIVLGGGIHMIDLIFWLTDDQVKSVYAKGNRIHSKGTKFRYDDVVTAILQLESGAIVNLSCNFGNVSPHFHQLDVYGTQKTFLNREDHALLYSERDVKNGNFHYLKEKPVFPEYKGCEILKTTYKNPDKGSFVDFFIDAINGKMNKLVTMHEIEKSMDVAFAIVESSKTGNIVKLKHG